MLYIKVFVIKTKIEVLILFQKFWILVKKYAEKNEMKKLQNFVMVRYFSLSWRIKFLMKDLKVIIDNC